MVKCTGRCLVVKRPGVLSKVQMLNLVLGVGVFSLLPISVSRGGTLSKGAIVAYCFVDWCLFNIAVLTSSLLRIFPAVLVLSIRKTTTSFQPNPTKEGSGCLISMLLPRACQVSQRHGHNQEIAPKLSAHGFSHKRSEPQKRGGWLRVSKKIISWFP